MAYSEDNSVSHEITTNARFRAWGAKVREMLEAIGLERTGDTGQINWATVEFPAVIETDAGYEIYAFTDALQATRPIVFKVFYGRGAGEKRYRIGMQVGSKSNGTGTIEGGLSLRRNFEPAITSGFAALGRLHACFSESDFTLFLCVNPAQAGGAGNNAATGIFGINRCRDVDGTIRSSATFADVCFNSTAGPTAFITGGQQRNGEEWTASFAPTTVGQAPLVNNVASPSLALTYTGATGRVVGPILGRLGFTPPAAGDKGKVEIFGKEREYIKAFSAQMDVILLRE